MHLYNSRIIFVCYSVVGRRHNTKAALSFLEATVYFSAENLVNVCHFNLLDLNSLYYYKTYAIIYYNYYSSNYRRLNFNINQHTKTLLITCFTHLDGNTQHSMYFIYRKYSEKLNR